MMNPSPDHAVTSLSMSTILDRLAVSHIKVRQLQRWRFEECSLTSAQYDDVMMQIERQVRELGSIVSTLRHDAPGLT